MKGSQKLKSTLHTSLGSQSKAVKALNKSLPSIERAVALLHNRKGRIIVTGVGKSSFIGMKIAATLTSLGEQAQFLHPVEAIHGDLGMVAKNDILISISFSGESKEVIRVAEYLANNRKIKVITITGGLKSTLAKLSNVIVPIFVKDEGSPLNLAPMASTTATLAAGDIIASSLATLNNFEATAFAKSHPGGSLGKNLTSVREIMLSGKATPIVAKNSSLKEALRVMTENGRGVVGVVEKSGKIVGVITDGDVRRYFLSNDNAKTKAENIMNKKPKTINPEQSIAEALTKMEHFRITSLFVVDSKHQPLGLIHMHDILERTI